MPYTLPLGIQREPFFAHSRPNPAEAHHVELADDWHRVLRMGEVARQLELGAERDRVRLDTQREHDRSNLSLDRSRAFWLTDLTSLAPKSAALLLVLFLGWALLMEREPGNTDHLYSRRMLPMQLYGAKRAAIGAKERRVDWESRQQVPIFLPPVGNLASYRRMRGGEMLPMTGELGELEDGSWMANLPPIGHYAHGPSLIMLPQNILLCAWLATQNNASAILLSWWQQGQQSWVHPLVLWKEEPTSMSERTYWERPVLFYDNVRNPRLPMLSLVYNSMFTPAASPPPHAPPPLQPFLPPKPRPISAIAGPPAFRIPPPYTPDMWKFPDAPAPPLVPLLVPPLSAFKSVPAAPPMPSPPAVPPTQIDTSSLPMHPLTDVMILSSKGFSLEDFESHREPGLSAGHVPMIWAEPRPSLGSAGLRLSAPPISALEWWGHGWLVPATVHVAQGDEQVPEYSVLRYYDEDMDPRKEFVLTTKDEGLIYPVVVQATTVIAPSPPLSSLNVPGKTTETGFVLQAPASPPSVFSTPPKKFLVALFSSVRGLDELRRVHRATSMDGGATWSKPTTTSLPNYGTPVALAILESGTMVCVFTNSAYDVENDWTLSTSIVILSVALSYDNGITWPWVRDLQEHYDRGYKNSEPSIVSNAIGDRVHITFTSSFYDKQWSMRRRSKIVHMSVSTQWIKQEWKNGVASIGAFKGDVKYRN